MYEHGPLQKRNDRLRRRVPFREGSPKERHYMDLLSSIKGTFQTLAAGQRQLEVAGMGPDENGRCGTEVFGPIDTGRDVLELAGVEVRTCVQLRRHVWKSGQGSRASYQDTHLALSVHILPDDTDLTALRQALPTDERSTSLADEVEVNLRERGCEDSLANAQEFYELLQLVDLHAAGAATPPL